MVIQKIISRLWGYDNPKKFKSCKIANTVLSKPDKRDYHPLFASNLPIPDKVVISPRPPIRNQSSIGSCASHAALRAYEIQLMAKNRYVEGAELYHYYCARAYVNNSFPSDKGMSMRDACKTLHKYNMCMELAWPYDITKYNTKPPWYAFALSHIFPVDRYERLYTLSEILQSLAEGIPVVCGIWTTQNYNSLRSGLWRPIGKRYGGHAQTIVGYDDVEGILFVENSWGTRWGNKGTYWIRYDDFEKVSFDWFRIIPKKW